MNGQPAKDYRRIEESIHFLTENFSRRPALKEAAGRAGLSEFHFQRIFTRWAGISPKRFLQYLAKEHVMGRMKDGNRLLELALDAGLSGSGRLHDLIVSCEAVTPGEMMSGGKGVRADFGFHSTPFGECLIAVTPRGIAYLAFIDEKTGALEALKGRMTEADLRENPGATAPLVEKIFTPLKSGGTLHLALNGTNFQIKVWEALLAIPEGAVVSYEDVAKRIGMPSAARAVGNAVGSNPIAYLIPCHRVIRKVGDFGNYRWGAARKMLMLGRELAKEPAGVRTAAG